MGTFHDGLGDLHGITVVVDARGSRVAVGRCHTANARGVTLLDADVHEDGPDGSSREEYLRRAASVGVWARHRRLQVPREDVLSVRPLGEVDLD